MSERERLIEERRKLINNENELRAAYRKIFGGGDTEARLLIEDLEKLCYYRDPAYTGTGPNAVNDAIHRDGMRAVICHIKTMSTQKPLKEDELIKQLEKNLDEEGVS